MSEHYDELFKIDLKRLISETNVHKCTSTCFKYVKATNKKPECRGKFPRKLVSKSNINVETGNIELKRSDPYINNYNPFISSAVRCKYINDMKFLKFHYFV